MSSPFATTSSHNGNGHSPDPNRPPHEPTENGGDRAPLAFVKGGKRKRLSKACDACHKSKRRCDGTSPCSNCYYASKNCTYTDASGRPVPAPRNTAQDRVPAAPAASSINERPSWHGQGDASSPPIRPQPGVNGVDGVDRDATSKRSRRAFPDGHSTSPGSPNADLSPQPAPSSVLDPATTHELVNIFFAHCNPQRMILHKPSFSADLSLNKVPVYLVLAVCANAAPLSKSLKPANARLAGNPFFQEALSLMFDNSGRLLSEPSLCTAQALCLLEMHEIAASHSWTRHFRFFELALQVLEDSLGVHRVDNTAPPSPGDSDALIQFIERECTRRCFWFIETLGWISNIYTRKPINPRLTQLANNVRLPIDETTFELAVLSSSATSEYLRRPAPRTRYASQFGHMCRILEIYGDLETIMSKDCGPSPAELAAARQALEAWVDSLPGHLQFSEENLETQVAMFDTSSNSGAWCYCFMHAMYPCAYLALLEGEGNLNEPVPWVRSHVNAVLTAAGTRAKNTLLSACTLWSYSKYSGDDPQVHVWDREFEKVWGFKVVLVAQQWRQSQALERERSQSSSNSSNASQSPKSLPHSSPTHSPPTHSPPAPHPQIQEQPQNQTQSHRTSMVGQPYEGRLDPSGRTLLRPNLSAPVIEPCDTHLVAGTGVGSQALPSLKASGLLDSWNSVTKPPTDAFANGLSLSSSPQRVSPPQNMKAANGAPVGMSWLVEPPGMRS